MKGMDHMHFEELLRKKKYEDIWEEYCGFLDLSIQEYMHIQYRLLEEQMLNWLVSPLGQSIMQREKPEEYSGFSLSCATYHL